MKSTRRMDDWNRGREQGRLGRTRAVGDSQEFRNGHQLGAQEAQERAEADREARATLTAAELLVMAGQRLDAADEAIAKADRIIFTDPAAASRLIAWSDKYRRAATQFRLAAERAMVGAR